VTDHHFDECLGDVRKSRIIAGGVAVFWDTSSSAYDIPRGATRELGSASEQRAIIMMMIIICVDHFA
jgi:hypothetical protein